MATYFHGGGPDIQTDSLQTLYLMNPAYVGYSDASAAAAAPANMVLFNPAVNPINPMSFAYSPAAAAAAAGQEPIRSPHTPHPTIGVASHEVSAVHGLVPGRVQYNLWTQPPPPTQQQGLSLSLSSREMSAPAAEAAPNSGGNPKATSAAAQSFLMGSKYLKAAQQLLDEMVNVGKGGRAAHDVAAGKGKSEDSEGAAEAEAAGAGSGGGGQEETRAKRAAAELSTAEKQELQMKKAKLVNMLDEVEQRYRQYHHQMQIVISSFEAVAGHGSARTYTALALQTISKQFRCLRDAITGQIRATSKSLGEENAKTVGSRLRFVDHHLRQQRALQQLGMMQHNAWRPQRGLPERSVSILRAWLFEHFLHPYPKDSDKLMLAKQTGLTRSQVSNWFINARVRLWKPMVEEMYMEETKDREQINNNNNNSNNSNSNTEIGVEDNSTENEPNAAPTARQETDTPKSAQGGSFKEKQSSAMPSYYDDHPSLQQQQPTKLKKLRIDESVHAAIASSSHSIAGVDTKPSEMNNRALLMKFIESSGRSIGEEQGYHSLIAGATSNGGGGGGGGGGGVYGAYSIGEIGRFDSQNFAPRYSNNGVSLTLGLPHCENLSLSGGARAHSSFLSNEGMPFGRTTIEMGPGDVGEFCGIGNSSQAVNSQQPPNNAYDINIQSRKRFAAQLMPDFVS